MRRRAPGTASPHSQQKFGLYKAFVSRTLEDAPSAAPF
jgi:hypothetical protein